MENQIDAYDAKNTLYTELANILRPKYDGIFLTGDANNMPTDMPAATFILQDNSTYTRSLDDQDQEHHARFVLDIDVFSNLTVGRVAQAESIMKDIHKFLSGYRMIRNYCNPLPNYSDLGIYRLSARYTAVLDLANGQLMNF